MTLNESRVTEFIIMGLSDAQELEVPLFMLFLFIYLLTILNNLLIITLVCFDSPMHKPMYFFICNVSFIDILLTSVTAPNLLHIIITRNKRIPFNGCITQLFLFSVFGCTEYLLLTAMSYDRYIAICKPLHYPVLMNRKVCQILAGASWATGVLATAPLCGLFSELCYCSSNHINHFFCDPAALLKLACGDTSTIQSVIYTEGALITMDSFFLTLVSYGNIVSAILKISSSQGRYKAFSTCSSHLTVVSLFYIMLISTYMKPPSSYSLDEGKFLSVIYTNIIPMLNPIIYSLRNKDVKHALIKLRCSLY